MTIALEPAVPVLRIYDLAKAQEFYVGFLGMTVDWSHRFAADTPVYMQVSRGSLQFHLSEHHGDATPGASVLVRMTGIEEFNRELLDRNYPYARPGIEQAPWDSKVMEVTDPFGNRIRFSEAIGEAEGG